MLEDFRIERKRLESSWSTSTDKAELLLWEYTRTVDEYIISIFQKAQRKAGAAGTCWQDNASLVALGGYGRSELFPYSDIDLMILYRSEVQDQIAKISDGVLYPLWDTGLEIGHGVRTVSESIAHAGEDYYFLVALLDARFLHGSRELYNELVSSYKSCHIDGQRESFVRKMKQSRQTRKVKFGENSYLLEPHVKEGRGGMRDIQAMMWTASVVFGLTDVDDIEDAGLMLEEEKRDFLAAREFLTRLRSHMHLVSGRRTDQLYFEQQADVAGALGYHNTSEPRNVEQFMHDVYDALQTIGVATDLFFDHVDEVLGLVVGESKISDKIVEKGIEIKTGAVLLTATQQQLQAKPQTLIRVLLVMSRTGLPMHHRSRKAIPGLVNLITDKERRSPRFAKTFFALLLEAKDISTLLETMLETGLLAACIPEFLRISCLVQHDLYHIYTVDRHSVQAVAGLHELVAKWDNVAKDVKNVKILYLATLLHDIGKGSGRDHSLEGADLVKAIGKRLCLSERECEALSFLVRYHLFIPENALRRDLNDTVFIKRCGETIGELELLAMLYLLSVSDSKATGPSAWSDWKSALMEELYLKVYPYLDLGRNGVQDAAAHEQEGVQWLREQIRVQLKGNYDLKIDPEDLSTDYILSFAPEDIASHLLTQRDYYSKIRQKSLIAVDEENGLWSLLIMTADRPGLLAKICGVMTLNNLSVSKAQIFTWHDGTVVDVIDVKATDGLSFGEKDWQGLNEQLDLAIEHKMGLSHRLYKKLPSAYGRKMQMVGEVASKVVIDNESSDVYSVIEVYAPDIPGQLYYITQAMADFGINIHKAYIATEVEQLIDVFYVLDSGGQKLLDLEFQQEITSGILHSIFYPTGN